MKEQSKYKPFKIPENYFDNFNDKLQNRLNAKKSILPKNNGFIVPKNYFETIDSRSLEAPKTRIVKLRFYKAYYFAAASVAAIFLIFFMIKTRNTSKVTWNNLTHNDIYIYFENNEINLSTYEIVEVLPIDELHMTDILDDPLDAVKVGNYLNENLTDFEILNLEDYEKN